MKKKKKANQSKRTDKLEKKDEPLIDIEKSIINANRIMDEEKLKNTKPFITWMQVIINGLMIVFVVTSFLFAIFFAEPIINNIKNGDCFNLTNFIFLLNAVCLIIIGCYTFKVNKYIDNITNISDLTGISSFLLSGFATLIALLALILQAENGMQ